MRLIISLYYIINKVIIITRIKKLFKLIIILSEKKVRKFVSAIKKTLRK